MSADKEKMYDSLANWFHLITSPDDYEEEAAIFTKVLNENGALSTVLELGSGGGNNAYHMKEHFTMCLVDYAPAMLELSKTLNPDCEHLECDMRSFRIERQFDGVFIHDAISYLTTEEDLLEAIETAFVHCRPGGVALFVPDQTKETFEPSTSHGGNDSENRGLRYLEWTVDEDPSDTKYVTHFAYLMKKEDGSVSVEYDKHEMGVFPRELWLKLIKEVGFEAYTRPFDHSDFEPGTVEVFLGRRPSDHVG